MHVTTTPNYRDDPLFKKIEAMEAARKRTTPDLAITSRPVDGITEAPEVFQPREGLDPYHLNTLKTALKRNAKGGLHPVDVLEVEGIFYLVDGHHRLKAYREAGKARISVNPLTCTVREAMGVAGETNRKAALPNSAQERGEFAWKIVSLGPDWMTIPDTANAAGIGTATVERMRAKWKEVGQPGYANVEPWVLARRSRPFDPSGWDEEVMQTRLEELAEQGARAARGALSPKAAKNPDVVYAMACRMVGPERMRDAAIAELTNDDLCAIAEDRHRGPNTDF